MHLSYNCQQILVRDCIAGLLANLSVRDFQEIEGTRLRDQRATISRARVTPLTSLSNRSFFPPTGELNRAICWYLSCDKYWEDTKRQQRHTPWYLLTVFMILLLSSIYACYYVIWVCFKYVTSQLIRERSVNARREIDR